MAGLPMVALGSARRRVDVRAVDLALLAVAVMWGSSYLAAKALVTPRTIVGVLALRFALAALCVAVPLLPRLRETTTRELRLGLLYGLILSAVFVLETGGIVGTTATNAGLIISLTMLMTPWLEGRLRRTRIPQSFYLSAWVALVGVVLLTQSQGMSIPGWGDLLIVLAAAMRAIHVAVIDVTTLGYAVDSARLMVIQLAVVCVVMAAASIGLGASPAELAAAYDGRAWLLTLYLALACTAFAFFVQLWAVRSTSPARVSLLLGTEPVWAVAFGISIAGEPLTSSVVLGGMCVLGGAEMGRRALAKRVTASP